MDKETLVKELDKLLKDPKQYSSAYSIDKAYELGFVAGITHARRLLRIQLGLAVPDDLKD